MATRVITGNILRPDGSAFHGGTVRFRLTPDTFRASPAQTYPEDTITAVADANGDISVTLVSGTDLVYRVTLPGPAGDQFDIAVPDGSATTLEALRASFSGAPATVDSVEAALIALYGEAPTGRPPISVEDGGVESVAEATTVNFTTALNVSESPAGQANVAVDVGTGATQVAAGNHTHSAPDIPVRPIFVRFLGPNASLAWTNMPSTITGLAGDEDYWAFLDLSDCTEYRLFVHNDVAGAAGSFVRIRFSGNLITWTSETNGDVSIATTGAHNSGWQTLSESARGEAIYIGIWGDDGDGVADPRFTNISCQFR